MPSPAGSADLVVRRAGAAEAPALLALLRAAFAEHRGRLVPESGVFGETETSIADRLGRERAVVVEAAGRLVGSAFCADKGDHVYISRLAVDPGWRRRRVGALLIEAAADEARKLGRERLRLGVRIALPGNIAFFERLGFREVGRECHPGFAEPTSLKMEKPVAR